MRNNHLRRRDFIIGCAAVAWPLTAHAQQPSMPLIGFLSSRSPDDTAHLVASFRNGLAEYGYVEGQSVAIEYRWALGQYDRLPEMAAELAGRPVAVLVATGGEPAALAAKVATSSIPIVFATGGDPVQLGLAASYNRPGGNATGINFMTATMEAKRLGLLHELLPNAVAVGVLLNPNFPLAERQLQDLQEAARVLHVDIHVFRANTDSEIEGCFREYRSTAHRRAHGDRRSILRHPPGAARGPGGALCGAHNVSVSRICHSWRPDELWDRSARCLSPSR